MNSYVPRVAESVQDNGSVHVYVSWVPQEDEFGFALIEGLGTYVSPAWPLFEWRLNRARRRRARRVARLQRNRGKTEDLGVTAAIEAAKQRQQRRGWWDA